MKQHVTIVPSYPDLRNKFVQGASDTGDASQTGETDSVTPAVTVESATKGATVQATTLNANQMPSHVHNNNLRYSSAQVSSVASSSVFAATGELSVYPTNSTGSSQSHTHGLTDNGHTHTAQSSAVSILPRYYKLLYCVKLPDEV